MIERQFVAQRIKEFQIQEYIGTLFGKAGYSHTEIHRTPLGEKVIIFTTRPGIVVGKKGDNIKRLTQYLKTKFKMENPQIEIGEIKNPMLDEQYVADKIAYSFEQFGSKRFKSIGYKVLQDLMNAGAIGAEVILSGKIPSARARSWRFSVGYMKKSGEISQYKVHKCITKVNLKSGTIGIKVAIMTPDIVLQDKQLMLDLQKQEEQPVTPVAVKKEEVKIEEIKTPADVKQVLEEIKEQSKDEKKAKPKKAAAKKEPKEKKASKKKEVKKEGEDGTDKKE